MKFIELIEELKSLTDKGLCSRAKIDWWVLKHQQRYNSLSRDFDLLKAEFPKANIREHKLLKKESEFIKLYEKLYEVSEQRRSGKDYQELIDLNYIINDIKY